jgi:hypothetical protein
MWRGEEMSHVVVGYREIAEMRGGEEEQLSA